MEPSISFYPHPEHPVVCSDYRQPPYSLTGEVHVPYLDSNLEADIIPFEIDESGDPVPGIIETIQIAAGYLALDLRAVSIT